MKGMKRRRAEINGKKWTYNREYQEGKDMIL